MVSQRIPVSSVIKHLNNMPQSGQCYIEVFPESACLVVVETDGCNTLRECLLSFGPLQDNYNQSAPAH